MQEALRVYDALSHIIYKDGHTYVNLMQLKEQPKVAYVTKWEESLAYLKEINVVKTYETGGRCHVFLTHIRGYEKTIARNLTDIMGNEPWIGNIEIDEQVSIAWVWYILFCIIVADVQYINKAQLGVRCINLLATAIVTSGVTMNLLIVIHQNKRTYQHVPRVKFNHKIYIAYNYIMYLIF